MAGRKRTFKRKFKPKRKPSSLKVAGYTKVGGKLALVFQKGKTKFVGKQRFSSAQALLKSARKYKR